MNNRIAPPMRTTIGRWLLAGVFAWLAGISTFAAEDVNKLYTTGFGDKDTAVRAAHNAQKSAAFARELLESASALRDDPVYRTLLLEKAYEFGMLYPDGVSVSIEAMEQLAKASPEAKNACDEKLLNALYKQFQSAAPRQSEAAAVIYVNKAMEVAENLAEAGKYDQAIALCAKAKPTTPLPPEIRAQIADCLQYLKDQQTIARRIAELKAKLTITPRDLNVSTELVRLLVLNLDRPAEAVEYLPATGDEKLQKFVPLAAKEVTTLGETELMELGDWYRSAASKAGKPGAAVVWSRAKACYQRFLKVHEKQDAQHLNASRALKDADAELVKLPAQFKSARGRARRTDLLVAVNPADLLKAFDVTGHAKINASGELELWNGTPSAAVTKQNFAFPISAEFEACCLRDGAQDIFPAILGDKEGEGLSLTMGSGGLGGTCEAHLFGKKTRLELARMETNRVYKVVLSIDASRNAEIRLDGKTVFSQIVPAETPLKGHVVLSGGRGHVLYKRCVVTAAAAD